MNYEDPDPPAKRGRAKGQMPNFGFAAWGCGTTDCVRVKTELILFFSLLSFSLSYEFLRRGHAYLYRVFFLTLSFNKGVYGSNLYIDVESSEMKWGRVKIFNMLLHNGIILFNNM